MSQELAQLQANAPAMGWPFVKRRMAAELGAGLAEALQELRARGGGARPRSARCIAPSPHDGTRARLQAAISRHALGGGGRSRGSSSSIFSIYERYDRAIHTEEIHAEIADRLREELDYEREAAHMRALRA